MWVRSTGVTRCNWLAMVGGAVVALLLAAAPALAQRTGAGWWFVPEVVVVGPADDPRVPLVHDAVSFWNRQLQEAGSAFRLGEVRVASHVVPQAELRELGRLVMTGQAFPADIPPALRELPPDLAVVLTPWALVSYASPMGGDGRRFVAIRGMAFEPMSLPGVARNLIAHEIGHALGLLHNDDPATLMCGRPAPCRPEDYAAGRGSYLPLAAADRAALAKLYPADWTARPR